MTGLAASFTVDLGMIHLGRIVRVVCSTALVAMSTPSLAGDELSPEQRGDEPAISDPAPNADSAISREEWRLRIDQARERAAQLRREWWLHPPPPAPRESADKVAEKVATERVLNDDTLQPGDIVSTDKGLLLFRGRVGADAQQGDFVPLRGR
jgi:hypothetical protein